MFLYYLLSLAVLTESLLANTVSANRYTFVYRKSSKTRETTFQLAITTALSHRDVNAIIAPVKTGANTPLIRSIRRSVAFVSILIKNE
jgi:hypothetical protein